MEENKEQKKKPKIMTKMDVVYQFMLFILVPATICIFMVFKFNPKAVKVDFF